MLTSKKAILIIHGFAGGPWDIENIANDLQYNSHYDVFTFTLPGHELAIMTKIKKEDWINKCYQEIEKIINHGYQNIYVIGHSMGGILATKLAIKYPEVKKLVLAAPAYNYLIFKDNNKLNLNESIKNLTKILNDYDQKDVISRIIKVPIPIIKEFMELSNTSYQDLTKLTIPTLIIHGNQDKLVPRDSIIKIHNQITSKTNILLTIKHANHSLFINNYQESLKVIKQFLKILNPYKNKKIIIERG